MSKLVSVIVIRPGAVPVVEQVGENDLAAYQALVAGPIEDVRLDGDGLWIRMNETARLHRLPRNCMLGHRPADGVPFLGTILIYRSNGQGGKTDVLPADLAFVEGLWRPDTAGEPEVA